MANSIQQHQHILLPINSMVNTGHFRRAPIGDGGGALYQKHELHPVGGEVCPVKHTQGVESDSLSMAIFCSKPPSSITCCYGDGWLLVVDGWGSRYPAG